MNRAITLALGILLTVTSSWIGLVWLPNEQLGEQGPTKDTPTAQDYPKPYSEEAARGRQVYQANGCVYCHSQQVRSPAFGSDVARGWGERRSVPRDYIYDRPHLLGTMRTGPDLMNVADRLSSPIWHHQHLYNPRMMTPGSIMPSFAFLYEKRAIGEKPAEDAVPMPAAWSEEGVEIVPKQEAKDLVAYLMTLGDRPDLAEAGE